MMLLLRLPNHVYDVELGQVHLLHYLLKEAGSRERITSFIQFDKRRPSGECGYPLKSHTPVELCSYYAFGCI